MKILLTGGTGFIGKYVLDILNKNNIDVFLITRQKNISNAYNVDLFDYTNVDHVLKNLKPDVLIHLAWDVTHNEYWKSYKNDLYKDASIHLFKSFLMNSGKKIIAAGTSAEYEESPHPITENIHVHKKKLSSYGQSKRECFEWLEKQNCDFTWLRIFGIFGTGEHVERFFPKAHEAIKNKESFIIKNPDIFADYIHAEEFAEIVFWALSQSYLGAINVGTGNAKSLEEWYEHLKGNTAFKSNFKPSQKSRIPLCEKLSNNGYNIGANTWRYDESRNQTKNQS